MILPFIQDIETHWKPMGDEPLTLKIIGSSALLLQTNYLCATADTDVLQMDLLSPDAAAQLEKIAGKDTPLSKRHGLYINIIKAGFPFLPPRPIFHAMQTINSGLKKFQIEALDVIDVVVSKLKPFRARDLENIGAMVSRNLIDPVHLVERFELAKDAWLLEARANELKKYIENLHTVQRDYLFVEESPIVLPDWLM